MDKTSKVAIKTETKPATPTTETKTEAPPTTMQMWRPFVALRHEVDRLFDDLNVNPFRLPFRRPTFDIEPFWSPESWVALPPIDFVERDNAYEVHADLPGIDEKDIEVKVSNGVMHIKGEKREEKEEKKEDFRIRERRFGSFERALRVPETVDVDKIEARFKEGVLTVNLPKTAEFSEGAVNSFAKGTSCTSEVWGFCCR